MKKIIKLLAFFLIVGVILGSISVLRDKKALRESLIRLHVVGNSDSDEDQNIKLRLKNAVTEYLQPIMDELPTKEEAMDYIKENINAIQTFSNQFLDSIGEEDRATVTFDAESFGKRWYETFSLPSGVYDALRIEIGKGEGKNWWCVVFPGLCVPATAENFAETAVAAGFSEGLTNTLTEQPGYEIRFFLMDCFGRIENIFYRG